MWVFLRSQTRLCPPAAHDALTQSEPLTCFPMIVFLCVLSLMSVSTLLWMEMVRRRRTIWGGNSTWWKRWLRSCLAWSPSAGTSWGESKTFCALSLGSGQFLTENLVDTWCVLFVTRLRPQDTEQRARLWKNLQSLLETYNHLRENDQSYLVEVLPF